MFQIKAWTIPFYLLRDEKVTYQVLIVSPDAMWFWCESSSKYHATDRPASSYRLKTNQSCPFNAECQQQV